MDISDKELLDRYDCGDIDAMDQLVRRHKKVLYSFLLGIAQGNIEADEVFQETWIRVIKQKRVFREGNFRGLLMKIARNVIIDKSRANKRQPQTIRNDGADNGSIMETLKSNEKAPGARLESSELNRKISAAVESLPDEQKEVFVLRVKSEITFKEIAEIQGVSMGTVLTRMQYALDKLRGLLDRDYKELTSTGGIGRAGI